MNASDNHPYQGIDSNRLSHAYIAAGSAADELAMAAVCSGRGKRPCMACAHCKKSSRGIHPDIINIEKPKDRREIVVDQIRQLKKDVIVVPNEAEKKVYIINDAHLMNISAQNAFLRILEEPPAHAVFILKTDNLVELLPTVRSRCVALKSTIDEGSSDASSEDVASGFFSAVRSGDPAIAAFMFRLEKLDREQFSGFLTAAREKAAALLRAAVPGDAISREILLRAEQALVRANEFLDLNVSTGHISGMLCANLILGARG